MCPFQINVGQTPVVFSIVLLSPDSVNISVTGNYQKLHIMEQQEEAALPCKDREVRSECNNKAGRGLTDKGLRVPKQEKQRSSGKSNQLQLRIQNSNQVLDDEAGPRSVWGGDQIHMHCPQLDTGQCLSH